MTSEKILDALAPCGLSCEKCFAYESGEIRQHSLKVKEKLRNFDSYAKRFEALLDNPIFRKYPDFKIMLDYFATENCQGCRKENCKLFENCGVRSCHQQKDVDFCFQCDEFPCDKIILMSICRSDGSSSTRGFARSALNAIMPKRKISPGINNMSALDEKEALRFSAGSKNQKRCIQESISTGEESHITPCL